MTREEHAIKELVNKGYRLTRPKILKGGINNAVYRVEDEKGNYYALKLYKPPNKNDPRNRHQTEKKFLKYMEKGGLSNTPIYINGSVESGWSLLSWIKGKQPKRLTSENIKEIATFIQKINHKDLIQNRKKLEMASESCLSLEQLIESINSRIKNWDMFEVKTEGEYEAREWVNKEIKTILNTFAKHA